MTCLLIRLAGPMQSWGAQSRFSQRDTGLDPSRSGVIGLFCAAMGRGRDEPLDDFTPLKMGVRVDREGVFSRDYHTAGGGKFNNRDYGVIKADGSKGETVISQRFYLSDAVFLVAIEGEAEILRKIHISLHNPVWPLYLGRKSFVPEQPVCLGFREGDLEEILRSIPWRQRKHNENKPDSLRLILECGPDEGAMRMDNPISFAVHERRYSPRYVKNTFCSGYPVEEYGKELEPCICPD